MAAARTGGTRRAAERQQPAISRAFRLRRMDLPAPQLGIVDVLVGRRDVEVAQQHLVGERTRRVELPQPLLQRRDPAQLVLVLLAAHRLAVGQVGAGHPHAAEAGGDQALLVVRQERVVDDDVFRRQARGRAGRGWRRRCRSAGPQRWPRSRPRAAAPPETSRRPAWSPAGRRCRSRFCCSQPSRWSRRTLSELTFQVASFTASAALVQALLAQVDRLGDRRHQECADRTAQQRHVVVVMPSPMISRHVLSFAAAATAITLSRLITRSAMRIVRMAASILLPVLPGASAVLVIFLQEQADPDVDQQDRSDQFQPGQGQHLRRHQCQDDPQPDGSCPSR